MNKLERADSEGSMTVPKGSKKSTSTSSIVSEEHSNASTCVLNGPRNRSKHQKKPMAVEFVTKKPERKEIKIDFRAEPSPLQTRRQRRERMKIS